MEKENVLMLMRVIYLADASSKKLNRDRVSRSSSNSKEVTPEIQEEIASSVIYAIKAFCISGSNSKMCMKGDPGAVGAQGIKGEEGPRGPKGDPGIIGQMGPPGAQGIKGQKGDQCVGCAMMSGDEPSGRQGATSGNHISAFGLFVEPSTLTIPENKTAKFTCSMRGYNTGFVSWRRVNKPMPEDRTVLGESGILKIKRVMFSDSGLYTCTVNSPSGIAQATVRLRVQGKRCVSDWMSSQNKSCSFPSSNRNFI